MATLEALVQNLCSVLVTSSNGLKATLKAMNVEIEGAMDLKLSANKITAESGMNCKIKAGAAMTGEGGAGLDLRSNGTADLNGGGLLRLKGSVVQVNGGNRPVARSGDPVGGNYVVGGSPHFQA